MNKTGAGLQFCNSKVRENAGMSRLVANIESYYHSE